MDNDENNKDRFKPEFGEENAKNVHLLQRPVAQLKIEDTVVQGNRTSLLCNA